MNNSYGAPALALMNALQWSTMKGMIRCETEIIVFKSVNNPTPEYLSHLLIKDSDCNSNKLRNTEYDLLGPFMKTSDRHKTFAGEKRCMNLATRPSKLPLYHF